MLPRCTFTVSHDPHPEVLHREENSTAPVRIVRAGGGPGLARRPHAGRREEAVPAVRQDRSHRPGVGQADRAGAYLENLADGWDWAEGPLWIKEGGYLLSSDIPKNSIIKWKEGEGKSVFLHPSGCLHDCDVLKESGSNGLTLDHEGRIILCQHGERRLARLEKDGKTITVLADHYDGKRFNSPNDVVVKSNGDVYFTDPPYGLVRRDHKVGEPEYPGMEMDYCGVYRYSKDGKLTLLTKEMTKPNGIAFSPDEKTLYVSNSDPEQAIWMAWEVKGDGTLGRGRVFYDATEGRGRS